MPDKTHGKRLKLVGKYPRTTRHNKGFSLIELMVAMSLFAFSLLAIMSLQVKALALLSDAGLKNQALILASSRKELHKLASKNIQDLDVQVSEWNSLTQNKIPQVNIKKSKISESEIYITLTWPSSHTAAYCDNNNQRTFDCFHL